MTKTYRYYLRDDIPRKESITMHNGEPFIHTDPFNPETDEEITPQNYQGLKSLRREEAKMTLAHAKEQSQILAVNKRADIEALKAELEGLGVSSQLLWVLE